MYGTEWSGGEVMLDNEQARAIVREHTAKTIKMVLEIATVLSANVENTPWKPSDYRLGELDGKSVDFGRKLAYDDIVMRLTRALKAVERY